VSNKAGNQQAAEIARRRQILARHIGEYVTIKRDFGQLSRQAAKFRLWERPAKLVAVNRTNVVLDFGDDLFSELVNWAPLSEWQWNFSITAVVLPGSIEPAPGQRQLFDLEGQA